MDFSEERKKEVVKDIITEYRGANLVDKYVKTAPVGGESIDEFPIRAEMNRPIKIEMLMERSGGRMRPMRLGSLFSELEGKHFFENLEGNSINIIKDDFNVEVFLENCAEIPEGKVLLPWKLNWKELIDDDNWKTMLSNPPHPIITVPFDLIKNKIIVMDNRASEWRYAEIHNRFDDTEKRLKIEFDVYKGGGNVNVAIKTFNKLEIIDKDLIKIINLV